MTLSLHGPFKMRKDKDSRLIDPAKHSNFH